VAEKLCLGDISTGASNDLQRATAAARKMVTVYGMSERLGAISFDGGQEEVFIGRTMGQARGYSEAMAQRIDEEVKSVIDHAYGRCEALLRTHRAELEAVAARLLEKETIDREEFLVIFEENAHPEQETV
jgi:cell division protease FtsH